jgi:hypothetical protein
MGGAIVGGLALRRERQWGVEPHVFRPFNLWRAIGRAAGWTGHWLVQLLYLAPLALLLALLGWGKLQEKRGKRPAHDDEPSVDDITDETSPSD